MLDEKNVRTNQVNWHRPLMAASSRTVASALSGAATFKSGDATRPRKLAARGLSKSVGGGTRMTGRHYTTRRQVHCRHRRGLGRTDRPRPSSAPHTPPASSRSASGTTGCRAPTTRQHGAQQGMGGEGEGRRQDRLHHLARQQDPADHRAEAQAKTGHDILAFRSGLPGDRPRTSSRSTTWWSR